MQTPAQAGLGTGDACCSGARAGGRGSRGPAEWLRWRPAPGGQHSPQLALGANAGASPCVAITASPTPSSVTGATPGRPQCPLPRETAPRQFWSPASPKFLGRPAVLKSPHLAFLRPFTSQPCSPTWSFWLLLPFGDCELCCYGRAYTCVYTGICLNTCFHFLLICCKMNVFETAVYGAI